MYSNLKGILFAGVSFSHNIFRVFPLPSTVDKRRTQALTGFGNFLSLTISSVSISVMSAEKTEINFF